MLGCYYLVLIAFSLYYLVEKGGLSGGLLHSLQAKSLGLELLLVLLHYCFWVAMIK